MIFKKDLPNGQNTNASGLIALLEVARILTKFYEEYGDVINYDVLFLFTSAGHLDFAGTKHFVDNLDSKISENLQFCLCLDSLSGKDLTMYYSRLPKEQEVNPLKLYEKLRRTAENMKIKLNMTKKKVLLTEKFVPWEHEHFSGN